MYALPSKWQLKFAKQAQALASLELKKSKRNKTFVNLT
jgi:hypothetical protein